MDWKILLVVILTTGIIIGFVSLGILLQKGKKREQKLRAKVEKWKGIAEQHRDAIKRFLDQKANEELDDDEAIKKANELIADWSAVDSGDTS